MNGKADDDDILSSINITPLVDIMLVLLIIFMVTTTFLLTPSIPVDLPRAATGEDTPAKTFALVIDRHGNLYLNGEAASPSHVSAEFRRAVSADPETVAILAADGAVDYQSVIRALDLVKTSGVKKFALNVHKE